MGVILLLGYRIIINKEVNNGPLTWSVLFENGNNNGSNDDINLIFNVASEFAKALANLQPQENSPKA